ncbi:MAG: P-loop ATPase, MinD superfamily [Candidatus Hecatellales archaeon B24]|nr:MAG: P-loop ATPase, MinD superfamily [Candidatus Hecatellales archaeon B24]
MLLAVAGGKGGCGKTTVAVNLALSLEGEVQILDCDVEEPNVHLLLTHQPAWEKPVTVSIPSFNMEKCLLCGKCSDFCQYNAVAQLPNRLLFFQELCHSCGGCRLVCPAEAIAEVERPVGVVKGCRAEGGLSLVYGVLNVGEPRPIPVVEAVRAEANPTGNVIIDVPPGASCPVVASIREVDHLLLVTEPTPMGLHDLSLMVDVARRLSLRFSVVVNRAGLGGDGVYDFCRREGIPVLMEIPYSRRIAELYSQGIPFVKAMPEWKEKFREVFQSLQEG